MFSDVFVCVCGYGCEFVNAMTMECINGHNPVDLVGGKKSVFQFLPLVRITNFMVVKEVSGRRFSNRWRIG